MHWMESPKLKTPNLLRATNPENFSSFGQIRVSKYHFSKAKITCFEKTSFELTVTEVLKNLIELHYLRFKLS